MASEHGASTIPLDQMRWREKIDEVKRAGVSVAQCIKTDFGHHTGSISHETWINVIQPLQGNFAHLEAVMISLVQDVENSSIDLGSRPGDAAPQDPPPQDPAPTNPPGDSVPVNQEDLGATQRERDRLNNQNQQQG